jgi:protein O-GlcNAc transferase
VLGAVGLAQLVTRSLGEYEALALALAHDPGRLAGLRAQLEAGRRTLPLFDTERSARHLEAAYRLMLERAASGLPPADLRVPRTASRATGGTP